MKVCSKCGNFGEFFRCGKSRDGLQSQCKACKSSQLSKYYRDNPQKVFRRSREQSRSRYEKNKISMNISNGVRRSLRSGKSGRSWEALVGYTLTDLTAHLESLFTDGMTWENYGMWHIDHIRPVSSFAITDSECPDFLECWSLENLQPLWAEDNLSKGSKINWTLARPTKH